MSALTASPAWQALAAHAATLKPRHLRELFAEDGQRFDKFSLQAGDVLLDYAKQRITPDTMNLLAALYASVDVPGQISRMRAGEPINHTEGRAVLHHALRYSGKDPILYQGQDVMPDVRKVLAKMRDFCVAVRTGAWKGATGERIQNVVNIGIGGSDLGARMASLALISKQIPELKVHYVSNLDSAHLATTLARLQPASTLFIVASKTFTTQETMQNARSARRWLVQRLGEKAVAQHFVAVSTNKAEVTKFGIDPHNMFEFWDWVGGRFSLWSAIGLPLAMNLGFDNFKQLLAGAEAMDKHFFDSPVERNMPALLALLEVWNTNFLGGATRVVLPYSQSLEMFPSYLQQLEMESNGKQVDRQGQPVDYATAPILWGEAGTNGQHAFYQLIHQGGSLIPCEFFAFKEPDYRLPDHHEMLLANCFAQSDALALGKTFDEVKVEMTLAGMAPAAVDALAPYRVFPGNQPSSTLLISRLDPYTLGQLIALYEHKVFILGALWNLNSFDQWGVEYGKQLASKLLPILQGKGGNGLDSSTAGLIAACRKK